MSFENIVIAILLIAMIGSLASAFWYMYKDRGKGTRTVKALTLRISIWVVLFFLIVAGIYTGWIKPSNTIPMPMPPKQSSTN